MVRDTVKKCPSCGVELEAADAYCWWCGTAVGAQTRDGRAAGTAAEASADRQQGEIAEAAAKKEPEPVLLVPVAKPAPVSEPAGGGGIPWGWVLLVSVTWIILGAIVLGSVSTGYQSQLEEAGRKLSAETARRNQAEAEVSRLQAQVSQVEAQVNQLRGQIEYERQVAQREKKEAIGAALFRAAPVVFGPRSGSLRHNNEDNFIERLDAGVSLRDFVAEATFYNPYDFRQKEWTYGFGFRHTGPNNQYRLVIYSFFGLGRWELMLVRGDPNNPVFEADGDVGSLKLDTGAPNTIRLVADGPTGELYVNGWHIATLDLSGKLQAGDVWVGIGFYNDTEITGRVTLFENFVVRRLP